MSENLRWVDVGELDETLQDFMEVLDAPQVLRLQEEGYSLEDTLSLLGVSLEPMR